MSRPEDQERYRQLALFSIIVAEIALVPVSFGGLVYYFTQSQGWALLAGAIGLVVGSYRVYLLVRKASKDSETKDEPTDPNR